jgi:hypothetical protein
MQNDHAMLEIPMRGIEEKDIENMPKMFTSHASEMCREAFCFLHHVNK